MVLVWCRFSFFVGFWIFFFFNICYWQIPRYCSHRLLVFPKTRCLTSLSHPLRAVLQTVNNDLSEKHKTDCMDSLLKNLQWLPIAHRIKSYLSNLSRSGLSFLVLAALFFIIQQATHAQTHTPHNNEHSTLLPSIEATGSHWVCPLSILSYWWFDSSATLCLKWVTISFSPATVHACFMVQL